MYNTKFRDRKFCSLVNTSPTHAESIVTVLQLQKVIFERIWNKIYVQAEPEKGFSEVRALNYIEEFFVQEKKKLTTEQKENFTQLIDLLIPQVHIFSELPTTYAIVVNGKPIPDPKKFISEGGYFVTLEGHAENLVELAPNSVKDICKAVKLIKQLLPPEDAAICAKTFVNLSNRIVSSRIADKFEQLADLKKLSFSR